jgi:hypothetical protein
MWPTDLLAPSKHVVRSLDFPATGAILGTIAPGNAAESGEVMAGFLRMSERLKFLPVVHGSGDFAIRVREEMLSGNYDCIAVPLPASFQEPVMSAIEHLPAITAVVQEEPENDSYSFVPIDPCQPVIAALRFAQGERLAVEFVDLETQRFEVQQFALPDPNVIKGLPLERYLAAVMPALDRPDSASQLDARVRRMAFELHRLELDYRSILFLPSVADWLWIREAYVERRQYPDHESFYAPIGTYAVEFDTLAFFLGELPFVTAQYERRRETLEPDENLSVDGIKELLLAARTRWCEKRQGGADWLTAKHLQIYLQYVRNLTLLGRRLSPDLYTLVVAARQIGGDSFALALVETAKDYAVQLDPPPFEKLRMGIGRGELHGIGVVSLKSRLAGIPVTWRTCTLRPDPPPRKAKNWRILWNPHEQCSWPPEDQRIESFHTHVREQAKALIGSDLARTEKFTTSVKDGLDIRETLRNWHRGELYVKEIPPARGGIEVVVFLFDVPADPPSYPWRTTWFAEHSEESTIGLFATDFRKDMVGPGIGRALYGGVFFLFPPRWIADIWTDPRLPRCTSLEDRLVAAAAFHSAQRHVAVVAPCPLRVSWRRLARSFGKRLIHLPLSRFSARTVDRLRVVHVLNGKRVRSYAAQFIRDG